MWLLSFGVSLVLLDKLENQLEKDGTIAFEFWKFFMEEV